ncbi:virB8 family protein [Vibrio rotiferianus]|uniref:virB8 family protein n=1 Tax=Vibrio rotiferianus TaxID=190895 RepID=UPI0005EEC987|nr:type IV secretion system protein [Vibrio rotiferianus]
MILSKKEQEALFDDALDFETSKSIMAEKSEDRAWMVAKGACALTVLSWVALVLLMPLKTVEPYVVTVDKNSGHTQVVSVQDQNTDIITVQEALDRYWLSNYIRWREVYDWYTLQKDYNTTLAFSSPNVKTEYASIYEGENALDSLWGKRIKATVNILSYIVEEDEQVATIRFEKTIKNVEERDEGQSSIWIATISYHYNGHAEMTEEERDVNPLAFEVTSYRVDPELVR